ncbi:hypothetical protein [Streptacidiphilus cavernicola]|uniref:Uncharacterized protein n=1 Tax=Streptacidiphilus cavernicola TaxID=3342716 RepID=A0ABV6W087_9ACTN
MTSRTFVPSPIPTDRVAAVVDDDCATCHGTGRSSGGVPCRPCGVRMTPKQRENVARLRLARWSGLRTAPYRQGF